jgi:hypothetical protein
MRRLVIAALVAVVCLLATGPSVAHAATPCWKRVIKDWTVDGRIDGTYSPHCLRQAINHVPEDLRDYSSIVDDINAALLGPSGPGSGNGSGFSGNGGGTPGGTNPGGAGKPSPKQAQRQAEKVVPHAGTAESIPDSSRTLPLPLLILAAVALAAMLAAASPPLIKRVRTRFPRSRAPARADQS